MELVLKLGIPVLTESSKKKSVSYFFNKKEGEIWFV